MTHRLELRRLTGGYGDITVIRDIDLHVDAGEVVAVLGANGAGKTTAMRVTVGLAARHGGLVLLDGNDVSVMAPERRARSGVAYVAQGRAVLPSLTVQENLRLVRNHVIDPFEWFPDLRGLLRRRAGLLSGGEQQMLAIGRAIAAGPCVLLVDEPSLGLAPLVVDSVLENLRRYATATGAGVVLVEQHTDLALAIADRGYVFANGSVIAQGLAADLRADATGLAASYLGGR